MYGGLFMNTITIDNNTYNSIVRYAQQNNISVSEAVVTGLNSFLEKFKEKVSTLSVVTANFICVECCKMPLDVYRRKMNFLRNFIEICSVDSSDIYSSYDSNWKDFEDGAQYFSATRAGVDYLVTRNIKDFEECGLRVITVDEACDLI